MRAVVLLLFCVLCLSSCKLFKAEEYTPEYLREDSPLDPPGTAAARAALRAKYLKEGAFAKGDKPEVNGGKILLCNLNPEREQNIKARVVTTNTVKIIACEGTYYFVEAEGGERGYAKETDLMGAVGQLPLLPDGADPLGPLLPGDAALLPEDEGGVSLGDNQHLTKDKDGRKVIVTGKKTQRSSEFEERQRALQQGQRLPGSGAADDDGANTPLPASSLDRR